MAPIYSLKMMRTQVLNEIRHPGDTTMQTFVDAWLNEQVQHYAEKWDFHTLVTRWKSLLPSAAQFDTTLPRLLRDVPRDMIKPMQAWLMDPNETPENWSEIKVIPMKEFDRKFSGASFTENPNTPTHMALREMDSMVFEPRTQADAAGFTEDFEALTPGADLNAQGGWTVTSPALGVGTVDGDSEMTGANSLRWGLINDNFGYPYIHDVPPAEAFTLSWNVHVVLGTLRLGFIFVTDGLNPTAANSFDGPWGIQWNQIPSGGIIANIGGSHVIWSTLGNITTLSAGDHTFQLTVDRDKVATFSIDGTVFDTHQLAGSTMVSRLHVSGFETFAPAVGTAMFDEFEYEEEIPPSEFPIGLFVTSTDGSEDADLKVGVNYYASADRQRIVKGEISEPGTSEKTITAQAVYGVVGIGKSDYSSGEIEIKTTYGERVAILMPHEVSAQFWALAFYPYPDLDFILHLIYKRRPPIMRNESDTFFLLPGPLGPAILQGAIVRGLKFLEDNDWLAAEAVQAKLERDFIRFHLTDQVEDAYAYIG